VVTGVRAAAWGLTIAATALGLAAQPIAGREPPRYGPYVVLAADFHVHSFPGDGSLTPWDIATEARRRGLDVVALTNHNAMYSWPLARMVAPGPDRAMLLPGVELTSSGYHMAAVGVHSPVAWRQPAGAAAAAVQAQGGVAIAAHPQLRASGGFDAAALDALDGFEAASSTDGIADMAEFRQHALTQRPVLAAIGASDFHYFAPIGLCRTFLFVSERSPQGVLEAVRRGRTVACDWRGETYGPAELAAQVSSECRRLATARPAGWSRIDAVSTGGAWLGLVILVALGSRERGWDAGGG
jgi:hypothetical protein